MSDDWFRNTTWSPEIHAEFFRRLNRARASSRAQYLRIQAHHLLSASADRAAINAALQLLDTIFREYPQRIQLAAAHEQAGQCHESLGDFDKAADEYLAAIAVEAEVPNVTSHAAYRLAQLAVAQDRFDLLEYAVRAMRDPTVPIQRYIYNASQAVLADRANDPAAAEFARAAGEAAGATQSGFANHPSIGIVTQRNAVLDRHLARIAKR